MSTLVQKYYLLCAALFFSWALQASELHVDPPSSFLALGDSYTIGESVDAAMRWPNQLVAALNRSGLEFEQPEIIAKTGWTTDELLAALDQASLAASYDYVSLLIGVNNQYRGRSVASFEPEFTALLERAISYSNRKANGVFVVSIPDWGVMPFAEGRDARKIALEIDTYNKSIERICKIYGVRFFDITEISRKASETPSFVASDGLHPSGEMYAAWVNEVRSFFKSAQQ
jgi:lysophospholipase L1-like esterase